MSAQPDPARERLQRLRVEERDLERVLRPEAGRVEVRADDREAEHVVAGGQDDVLHEARRERRRLGQHAVPVFDRRAAERVPAEPGRRRIRDVEAAVHDSPTCVERRAAGRHLRRRACGALRRADDCSLERRRQLPLAEAERVGHEIRRQAG